MTSPRLVLILPVYNFASHIEATLTKLKNWKQRHHETAIHIFFSDDGSTDATVSILQKWIATEGDSWRVVTHHRNTGKGAAIRRGLEGVRDLKPELVVFCDCDLHYGLEIIFDRMVPALAAYDVAIVDRSWRRDRVRAGFLRKLASAVFNRSVAILTGVAFRDTQAGLKAFRHEACWPIFEMLTVDGFTFDVEILSIALFYRLRVKQVPITIRKKASTSTVSILKSSFRMTIDLLKINLNWKTGRYEHPKLVARIEDEVYSVDD